MTREVLRLSQIVGVFGPGAMLDLPERSVLVGGLNHWDMSGRGAFKVIEEERLSRLLEQFLRRDGRDDGRVAKGRPLQLRTPPIELGFGQAWQGNGGVPPTGVQVAVFPTIFTCDTPDAAAPGQPGIRRRMVRWQDLDPSHQRRRYVDDAGKKHDVTPIRFVCGCQSGHLQDISWRWITHGDGAKSCPEPMWLEETGTSGEPSATRVVCGCGKWLSLDELFQPGRLGTCKGERPWIGDRDPAGCGLPLRLLTRSATNTYFPQVAVVISLPTAEDELTRRVREHLSVLCNAASPEQVGMARMFNPVLGETLKGYDDAEIFARLERLLAEGNAEALADPREAEFELLASGRRLVGENKPDALLHAETLDRDAWDKGRESWLAPIASLVKVHRLREVVCLYGFTRFEPAALVSDDGLEDVGLAVSGAPLGPEPAWLPALEQFGEGLFLSFDPDAVKTWLGRRAVRERAAKLEAGVTMWEQAKGTKAAPARGLTYTMVHGLSHALMTEIALDCGYPASALRERVYAWRATPGKAARCGLLIYTATAGTQGTLGGLVEVANRFPRVLAAALERLRLCSADPVCADHDPASATEDRALHGAACHGCLLVAETSCESRNVYLDRALLVATMADEGAALFGSNTAGFDTPS